MEKHTPQKAPSVHFEEKFILGTMPVFNNQANFEGMLEIQINLEDFQKSLGQFSTIFFSPNTSSLPEQYKSSTEFFQMYLKVPNGLWNYASENKYRLTIFYFYMLICLVLIIACAYFFNHHHRKQYQGQITLLKNTASQFTEQKKDMEASLLRQQQEHHYHSTSCQSHKKFYADYSKQQREQMSDLARSLALAENSFKNLSLKPEDLEHLSLIHSCRIEALNLAKGAIGSLKNETLYLKAMLEEIQLFFIEKTHKSNIKLEVFCRDDVIYDGDPTFIEFILINLIGKSIYKVPKGGAVSVSAFQDNHTVSVEIQDNGFLTAVASEKLIKKSLDLFIPNDLLISTCHEYGLTYEQSKNSEGLNITSIIFPTQQEEITHDNVVQLFK